MCAPYLPSTSSTLRKYAVNWRSICFAQIMEPDTGGRSLTKLMRNDLLCGYCTCRQQLTKNNKLYQISQYFTWNSTLILLYKTQFSCSALMKGLISDVYKRQLSIRDIANGYNWFAWCALFTIAKGTRNPKFFKFRTSLERVMISGRKFT